MRKSLEQKVQESEAKIQELNEKLKAQEAEKQRRMELEQTLRDNNEKIAELLGKIEDNKSWKLLVKKTLLNIKEKTEIVLGQSATKVKEYMRESRIRRATHNLEVETAHVNRLRRQIDEIRSDISTMRNLRGPNDIDAAVVTKYVIFGRKSPSETLHLANDERHRARWNELVSMAIQVAEKRLNSVYDELDDHRRWAADALRTLDNARQR